VTACDVPPPEDFELVDHDAATEDHAWTRETDALDGVPAPNGSRALIDDPVEGRYAGQTLDVQDGLRRLANNAMLTEHERRQWVDIVIEYGGQRCPECGVDVLARDHRHDCLNRVSERLDGRLTENAYTNEQVCQLPPLTPLVDGLLYLPGESVLYSPPKLAKTFWAIDLAECVASGQPFMGRDVHQGPVVFVVAEGVGGIGARVQAWHDFHGRAGSYVEAVTFITVAINLLDQKMVDGLCAFLKDRGAVLTIVDTLARCTPGMEENSARDMGNVVEALDLIRNATGGHVLVVHHAGKDVERGMRGSSALLGAVDTVIKLSGDSNAIRCAVTDQKDAEAPAPWYCHLQPVGSSAVIEQTSGTGMLTDIDRNILDVGRSLADEHRTAGRWQKAAEEDHRITESTFYKRLRVLRNDGRVAGGGERGARYTIPEDPE
jgi:AAA domain